jgi:hypothetical protein
MTKHELISQLRLVESASQDYLFVSAGLANLHLAKRDGSQQKGRQLSLYCTFSKEA